MQYASTSIINSLETVITVLPLSHVPGFDPADPRPGTYEVPDDVRVGWVRDAAMDAFVPPPPASMAQLEARYTDAVQRRLDDFAKTRGYDGILSACTYTASAVPQFQAEGLYAVSARDVTWAACYTVMAEVLGGLRPLPTIDELFEILPPLEWPE